MWPWGMLATASEIPLWGALNRAGTAGQQGREKAGVCPAGPGLLLEDHSGDGRLWRVRWLETNAWGVYASE